ncbi:Splicing factor 3B subunit like [Actinidia chinensis var. chinensis]|uniref:Splicing factor 3B subunit like n=1 Tax=Actinidia chinensis var. chinensis TaxID=1590841 RepID=A0A2R6PX05_ACTCC|nr:Splicing factor 3B subunit like [Actinidia chinensis var. chinensis]
MTSPITFPVDDKDLDDATLWAVIDSAAASLSSAIKPPKPLALRYNSHHHHQQSPIPISNLSPAPTKFAKNPRNHHSPENDYRPQKMTRSSVSELSETSPLVMVQRTPTAPPPSYPSPESRIFSVECSPIVSECSNLSYGQIEEKENMRHSLSGRFPSVSLFKEYQNAAMAILEKSDYTMISGSPFIKKSGWRKISFYFNLSFEIKDKTIEFDENRNVLRAEFVVRAHMQGGRFSDGWGSCERREKRFSKPNHDIPSTAETRAKNKACQDLLGIGEYRPGGTHSQR